MHIFSQPSLLPAGWKPDWIAVAHAAILDHEAAVPSLGWHSKKTEVYESLAL